MLGELALAPVLSTLPDGLVITRGLGSLVILAALLVSGFGPLAVALFLATIAADVAGLLAGQDGFHALAAAIRALFLARVVFLVARHVLAERAVTLDTLAGAACVYLLLGVLWADLYYLLELRQPGSFAVADSWQTGSRHDLRPAFNVFSMLTLSTVGSAAITPATPASGALCAAESLFGQLYLAVMIARLVGLHIAHDRA